ncbi:FAD dependent oxidoreductase [Melioribacter roseus P3M-2]|uniref:FAD dependent oxidoreductase n=1 Tax=Melioribacter roseus (strain DSM 23840 / JCM 17771 / VKM B-2668 / P3M-2) TaxID=1191523 RepID=I6Z7M2_MELRP|nr:FAD-dependent oxidoreductase [Melioribacter roseus]AFN75160.1 FAD dependent oxidoreductase [Melioribacter roseus P3M-2]
MQKEIDLIIPPENIFNYEFIRNAAAKETRTNIEEITRVSIIKRSVDARRKNPVYRIKAVVFINENPAEETVNFDFKNVEKGKRVIIVGFGPAGMFAALRFFELGIKPIILERGKDVRSRRRDLRAIQQFGIVNPDSNYCFGEGGAGTYSDGKLYTRSTKRGDVKRILNLLVYHGAQSEILIDSHPHIGSNILPKVVSNIRETILKHGGEIHFNSRVTDFIIENSRIGGVIVNDEKEYIAEAVILAVGHSARDIYYLLDKKGILIESKPFALGVRIEHPQNLIDSIQYHSKKRHPNLPAASYSIACQVDDKGVYSFCMCPGGIIVPASTAPGELVLNGMSLSRRDSPFANSGLVVAVDEKDWEEYKKAGVFAGLEFQKSIEIAAFESGGKNQKAPAQRVIDFLKGRSSDSLPPTSYIPGAVSYDLNELFPERIKKSLREALLIFNKKMPGFISAEAQILAAETRTSSPVRIPRDRTTFRHLQIEGLYPAGEGAGYAGGIVSAAIDGEKIAEAIAGYLM